LTDDVICPFSTLSTVPANLFLALIFKSDSHYDDFVFLNISLRFSLVLRDRISKRM
jgi:hypothetical protein